MEGQQVIKNLENQKLKDINTIKYMKNALIIMQDNYSLSLEELEKLVKDRDDIH